MSQNLELVRRFYDEFGRPGWRHLDLLAEDVLYRPIAETTETGELQGRDGYRHYMEAFFESGWADGLAIDEISLREYGDKVVARIEFAGQGRASGLDFAARVFVVHTLRDDVITQLEDFIDRGEALAAAGVAEQ